MERMSHMAVAGQAFCEVDGCPKVAKRRVGKKRVCDKHWMRWYRRDSFEDEVELDGGSESALERCAQTLMRIGHAMEEHRSDLARFSWLYGADVSVPFSVAPS